jgi:hypothetical protein
LNIDQEGRNRRTALPDCRLSDGPGNILKPHNFFLICDNNRIGVCCPLDAPSPFNAVPMQARCKGTALTCDHIFYKALFKSKFLSSIYAQQFQPEYAESGHGHPLHYDGTHAFGDPRRDETGQNRCREHDRKQQEIEVPEL